MPLEDFNKLNPTCDKCRMFELARNIEGWAADRNLIEGATPQAQMLKLIEEVGEIAAGLARGQTVEVMDGIGDVFVVITIMAKQIGVNVDDCIELAWSDIKDRKGVMRNGVFIKDTEQIVTEGVK